MSDSIRIATAQSPVTGDKAANGEAIRSLMVTAHQQGAKLIQFPEGALSGYDKRDLPANADWQLFDWRSLREQLELTAALAGELGLWVVLGSLHPLTPPNRPHNSLYIISDTGTLIDRYDKRLCSHNEITNWYSPGFRAVTFDVDGFTFGCVLCIEVNFAELFLEYSALGVDCVLFSSYSEKPEFETIARGNAAALRYWISMSVPAHCSIVTPSGVIGPHGNWLDSCGPDGQPAVVCVDLDRKAPALENALGSRWWRPISRMSF